MVVVSQVLLPRGPGATGASSPRLRPQVLWDGISLSYRHEAEADFKVIT